MSLQVVAGFRSANNAAWNGGLGVGSGYKPLRETEAVGNPEKGQLTLVRALALWCLA